MKKYVKYKGCKCSKGNTEKDFFDCNGFHIENMLMSGKRKRRPSRCVLFLIIHSFFKFWMYHLCLQKRNDIICIVFSIYFCYRIDVNYYWLKSGVLCKLSSNYINSFIIHTEYKSCTYISVLLILCIPLLSGKRTYNLIILIECIYPVKRNTVWEGNGGKWFHIIESYKDKNGAPI